MYVQTILWLSVCVGWSTSVKTIETWEFNQLCSNVETFDYAGKLHIRETPGPCVVTIKPHYLQYPYPGVVLFYFDTLHLDDCRNGHLTITDGPSEKDIVKGLPPELCGSNLAYLSDQYFTTRGDYFKVTSVQHNSTGSRMDVRIHFISTVRADGPRGCSSGDSEHECSNGWCVLDGYSCHKDFRACGEPDDNCSTPDAETPHGFRFTDLFGYLFIIVVILVALSILKGCFKKCRQRGMNTGFCDCLASCLEDAGIKCRRCRESTATQIPERLRYLREHIPGTRHDTRDRISGTRRGTRSSVAEPVERVSSEIGVDNHGYDRYADTSRDRLGLPPEYTETMATEYRRRQASSSSVDNLSETVNSQATVSGVSLTHTNGRPDPVSPGQGSDNQTEEPPPQYSSVINSVPNTRSSSTNVITDSIPSEPPPRYEDTVFERPDNISNRCTVNSGKLNDTPTLPHNAADDTETVAARRQDSEYSSHWDSDSDFSLPPISVANQNIQQNSNTNTSPHADGTANVQDDAFAIRIERESSMDSTDWDDETWDLNVRRVIGDLNDTSTLPQNVADDMETVEARRQDSEYSSHWDSDSESSFDNQGIQQNSNTGTSPHANGTRRVRDAANTGSIQHFWNSESEDDFDIEATDIQSSLSTDESDWNHSIA